MAIGEGSRDRNYFKVHPPPKIWEHFCEIFIKDLSERQSWYGSPCRWTKTLGCHRETAVDLKDKNSCI